MKEQKSASIKRTSKIRRHKSSVTEERVKAYILGFSFLYILFSILSANLFVCMVSAMVNITSHFSLSHFSNSIHIQFYRQYQQCFLSRFVHISYLINNYTNNLSSNFQFYFNDQPHTKRTMRHLSFTCKQTRYHTYFFVYSPWGAPGTAVELCGPLPL